MRFHPLLFVAFLTAAVAPVMAVPTPLHDLSAGSSGEKFVDERSTISTPWSNLTPNDAPACDKRGICKGQDIGVATVINDTLRQGLLTQDEANSLLQIVRLFTSDEGAEFLKGLETDIAPLLQTSVNTNKKATNATSHLTRSAASKAALAGTTFTGIGALANLANMVSNNLHYYSGNKREVDSMKSAANLSDDRYAGITTAIGGLREFKRGLPEGEDHLVS